MRKLVMDNAGNIDFSKQKFLYWGKKSFIAYLRKGVADIINKHLAKHGFTTRVSHLSYADRGIDIIPSKHQGLSRYVKNSSKEKQNKQIVQKNAELIINDPERIIDKLDINKPVYSLKEIKKALQESLYVTLKENTPLKQLENDKLINSLLEKVIKSPKLTLINKQDLKGETLYGKVKRLDLENRFIKNLQQLNQSSNHKLGIKLNDLEQKNLLEQIVNHSKPELSLAQKKAVLDIVNGQDIAILHGIPGAGKTFVMQEIVKQYKKANYKIIGVAPSSSAALQLFKATNIETKNASLWRKKWLLENQQKFTLELQADYYQKNEYLNNTTKLTNKHAIIIDEASMTELSNMDYLLSEAIKAEAKIILVGDNNQLTAVGFAGAFQKALEICGAVKLSESKRQLNKEHRKATIFLGNFHVKKALEIYQKDNSIEITANQNELHHKLLNDYINSYIMKAKNLNIKDLATTRSLTICTFTNKMARKINLAVREKLKNIGVIKDTEYLINTGGKYINICENEQIVVTSNLNDLGIFNGEVGTILSIKPQDDYGNATIKVLFTKADHSKKIVNINTANYDRKILDYGYALTAHKLQGVTVDQNFVVYEKQIGFEAFNVMMTRHREKVKFYANIKELHDNIYNRLDLNNNLARRYYSIKAKTTQETLDLIALNISISRKINNNFTSDYLKECNYKVIKEYITANNEVIKLTKEINQRKWQIENLGNSDTEIIENKLWHEFKQQQQRRLNARKILKNYNLYEQQIIRLSLNYATLEKHAGKSHYLVQEKTSYLAKYSHNFQELVKAIKTLDKYKIQQSYKSLLKEIAGYELHLEKLLQNLDNCLQEKHKLTEIITATKDYQQKLLPVYLEQIYKNSTKHILDNWSNLVRYNGKFMAAEMVAKNPYLLGNLKGNSFSRLFDFNKNQFLQLSNYQGLGKKLLQYQKFTENLADNQQKLKQFNDSNLERNLIAEIETLEKMSPAKSEQNFINYIGKKNKYFNKSSLKLEETMIKEAETKHNFMNMSVGIKETDFEKIFLKYAPKINPKNEIKKEGFHIRCGSLIMNLTNGLWYDFNNKERGNIYLLVKEARNCSIREAIEIITKEVKNSLTDPTPETIEYKPKILVYNKDQLIDNDKVNLIVPENNVAKKIVNVLPEYNIISWSGGVQNAEKVDWKNFKEHKVAIWYDNNSGSKKAAKVTLHEINKINNHIGFASIVNSDELLLPEN
ncbi:MAG: AAA family ATPase [Rickettsiaceae bacterium]|nr:AAA family ATPase [Rickettsiaceae bacterium]